jgi:hypothetical protein
MSWIKFQIIAVCLSMVVLISETASAQSQAMPEVFIEGTLEEQFDFLQQRTTIYNDFRAIRDDMFRRIRRNSLDSLNRAFAEINRLQQQIDMHRNQMDSLQRRMDLAVSDKDTAVAEKDNMMVMGMLVNKTVYNTVVWSIIGVLLLLFIVLLILYNRANRVANQKSAELKEVQVEYDEYRRTSRERFEKQAIDHFNELKRNRGI